MYSPWAIPLRMAAVVVCCGRLVRLGASTRRSVAHRPHEVLPLEVRRARRPPAARCSPLPPACVGRVQSDAPLPVEAAPAQAWSPITSAAVAAGGVLAVAVGVAAAQPIESTGACAVHACAPSTCSDVLPRSDILRAMAAALSSVAAAGNTTATAAAAAAIRQQLSSVRLIAVDSERVAVQDGDWSAPQACGSGMRAFEWDAVVATANEAAPAVTVCRDLRASVTALALQRVVACVVLLLLSAAVTAVSSKV